MAKSTTRLKKASVKKKSTRRKGKIARITLTKEQSQVLRDLKEAFPKGSLVGFTFGDCSVVTFSIKEPLEIKSAKNMSEITAGLIFPKGAYDE
jgi:hypothetical protein